MKQSSFSSLAFLDKKKDASKTSSDHVRTINDEKISIKTEDVTIGSESSLRITEVACVSQIQSSSHNKAAVLLQLRKVVDSESRNDEHDDLIIETSSLSNMIESKKFSPVALKVKDKIISDSISNEANIAIEPRSTTVSVSVPHRKFRAKKEDIEFSQLQLESHHQLQQITSHAITAPTAAGSKEDSVTNDYSLDDRFSLEKVLEAGFPVNEILAVIDNRQVGILKYSLILCGRYAGSVRIEFR